MKNLKYYQNIIKEKRKKTNFRDFVKEIASWKPFVFYKNKGYISRYPETRKKLNLVSQEEFEENRNNLYFCEYNDGDNFFEKFDELLENVALPPLLHFGLNENCDYSDCNLGGVKNAYLSTTLGLDSENIFYSAFSYLNVNNIFNCLLVTNNMENIYFSSVISNNCFNIFYSRYIKTSTNIWFSSNLIGCSECIFCDNLENQSYCIYNKKLEKEQYFKKKEAILRQKELFDKWLSKVNKKAVNYGIKNSNGNALYFSENIENGYMFTRIKNSRNIILGDGGDGCENFYDCFDIGINSSNFAGACSAGVHSNNIFCSVEMGTKINNGYYSYFLDNCNYCLGCIGLKNKSYCILNKQYSKEEWEKKVCEIFEKMEQNGTLGDFFPGYLNPFYFNDTMAYSIDNTFTKEEVESEGYMWRDEEIKVDIPAGATIITTKDLDKYEGFNSDGKWCINPEILKVVIRDDNGNYYRVVNLEYDFLLKYGLPLPRLHWLDRVKLHLT